MLIKTEPLAQASRSAAQPPLPELDQQADVSFFNAQLAAPGAAHSAVGANALVDRSNQLQTLSKRVTRGLRDLSANKITKDTREISKTLSNAHQQLAVTVKVVNKSVQMVEKLTNLQ
ncbi:hypothetical protein ACW9H6_16435 [Pseudomonas sp. SDO528_S397]